MFAGSEKSMDQTQFHSFTHSLTQTLAADDRVLALVAIGSLAQSERVDRWSDHDFWVITTTAAQAGFLTDLSWLPDHTAIALTLRPAEQYYTVLYATGHIAEFAIFGPHDLARGRLTSFRMLFDKGDITTHIQTIARNIQQEQASGYNASATFGHFLIALCTGAGRAARGEVLSASTYIFQYALDALLTLITHHIPPQRPDLSDPFDPRRRFERVYPDLSTTLIRLLTLPPASAARQMLDVAEQLFPDGTIALAPQAVSTTRAYLQVLEQAQM
jgi:hypothetical protein